MGGGCVAKIFVLSHFFFGFPSVSKMNECILLLLLLAREQKEELLMK